ncbi:hypothetical protein SD457_18090 [Coprobacillaceae bacterium CR2/5/TPMF4]|nr:hypothetical protein SD457_18090 [Coprobacillaceae bacterium CR2/5/TPMF4]
MLFTYKQIADLNPTETSVYQYVIKNIPTVIKMSVRDLAKATHVSTATIVRFCQKLDCQGFVEFKTKLKLFNEGLLLPDIDDEIDVILEFLIMLEVKTLKKILLNLSNMLIMLNQ